MSPRKSDQFPAPEFGNAPPASAAAAAAAPGAAEHHEPAGGRTAAWSFLKANVVVAAAILVLLPLAGLVESKAVGAYYARMTTLIGYNIILAVSLQLINGVSGQFSLGHAGFMAVGAYLAAYPAKTYARSFADPAGAMLFYVALAVVVVIVFGVLYGMLRAAGLLRAVHRSAPGVALLLLIVWIAVDISKASAAEQPPGWCVWSRGFGLLQDLFQGMLDRGVPAAGKISGWLPGVVARPLCFLVLLIGAGCCAAGAGLVVGLPALRLRGDYLAIVTLGMAEIIRIMIQNSKPLGGALGLTAIPRYTNFVWLYACVVLTVVCVWRVAYSARGRAIMAVREDEIAASSVGINTTRQKVTAFVLGAFFAGLAGALFAMNEYAITPTRFTLDRSIEVVVMVTLGGLGSISGSIIAAVVLTILPELLRGIAEYRMIIYSALLIVMMLARPQGLMGTHEVSARPVLGWLRRRRQGKGVTA